MSERKIQEMAKDEEVTNGEPEEAADEDQEPTAPEEVTRGVAKARGRLFATAKEAEKYLVAEEKRYLKIGRRTLTGWEARVCTAGAQACAELIPEVRKLKVGGRIMDLDLQISKRINKIEPPEGLEAPGPPVTET